MAFIVNLGPQMPSKRRHNPTSYFLIFFFSLSIFFLLLAFDNVAVGFLSLADDPPAAPFIPPLQLLPPRPPELHLSRSANLPNKLTPNKLIVRRSKPQRRPNNRRRRLLRKLLRPTPQSARFSSRAATFFFNSSCTPRFFMTWISSPLASFGPRELLSVESIFRSHPQACLLIASPSLDSSQGRNLLKPFTSRGLHVAALAPDYHFLLTGTPAEPWLRTIRNGDVPPGDVPIGQNLSNLLRLVLLYKYGGAYVDTDVLVLKSFLTLRAKNAIGAQAVDRRTGKWSRLNNAVMVFERNHTLLYEFIEEFARTFDGSKWGHNGPYLVSRVVERREKADDDRSFEVMAPAAFYPVDWRRVKGLFAGPKSARERRWAEAKARGIWEESLAVHLWNRQSGGLRAEEGSVVERIMSSCCLFCNSSGKGFL